MGWEAHKISATKQASLSMHLKVAILKPEGDVHGRHACMTCSGLREGPSIGSCGYAERIMVVQAG